MSVASVIGVGVKSWTCCGRQPFSFVAREPTIAAVIDADGFRELRYGGSPLAAALMPRIHAYLIDRYRTLLDATLGQTARA